MMVNNDLENNLRSRTVLKVRCQTLTSRQREALNAIYQFRGTHARSPTYRELAALLGLTSPSPAHNLVMALEAKGYVKTEINRAWNGIEILRMA